LLQVNSSQQLRQVQHMLVLLVLLLLLPWQCLGKGRVQQQGRQQHRIPQCKRQQQLQQLK
jgi:hypothetical protein